MDGLDVITGRGEFPLYLHTKTSYKGHHIPTKIIRESIYWSQVAGALNSPLTST